MKLLESGTISMMDQAMIVSSFPPPPSLPILSATEVQYYQIVNAPLLQYLTLVDKLGTNATLKKHTIQMLHLLHWWISPFLLCISQNQLIDSEFFSHVVSLLTCDFFQE